MESGNLRIIQLFQIFHAAKYCSIEYEAIHSHEEDEWLNPHSTEPHQIADLMKPYENNEPDMFEVRRDVNVLKNENE